MKPAQKPKSSQLPLTTQLHFPLTLSADSLCLGRIREPEKVPESIPSNQSPQGHCSDRLQQLVAVTPAPSLLGLILSYRPLAEPTAIQQSLRKADAAVGCCSGGSTLIAATRLQSLTGRIRQHCRHWALCLPPGAKVKSLNPYPRPAILPADSRACR